MLLLPSSGDQLVTYLNMRVIQKFDVGLKAFIEKEEKLLIVRESSGGLWEMPGGRIDVGEESEHLHNILLREVREELGGALLITIGQPFYSWIRPLTNPKPSFVFLTGYRCQYEGGEIALSNEHADIRWISRGDVGTIEWAPGYREAFVAYWQ